MKKFFFSLNTVLDSKEQVLESLRAEHVRSLQKVRACEAEIEQLEQQHKDCVEEFEDNKRTGIAISDKNLRRISGEPECPYFEKAGAAGGTQSGRAAKTKSDDRGKKGISIDSKAEREKISGISEAGAKKHKSCLLKNLFLREMRQQN